MNGIGLLILLSAFVFPWRVYSSPVPGYKTPVTMQMKWIEGKRYNMRLAVDDNEETMLNIEVQDINDFYRRAACTREFSVTVAKTNSWGGAELDLELTKILYFESGFHKSWGFDSHIDADRDHDRPIVLWLRTMKGSHVKFNVGADGKVETILNYDDYWNRVTNGAPAEARDLLPLFDERSLKRIWFATDILPVRPVLLRETWPFHRETRLASGQIVESDIRTTFKGVGLNATREFLILEFSGVSQPKPAGEPRATDWDSGVSTVNGHVWLDAISGEIVEGHANYSVDLVSERNRKASQRIIGVSYHLSLIRTSDSEK